MEMSREYKERREVSVSIGRQRTHLGKQKGPHFMTAKAEALIQK
jgi:hypothetical protein